MSAQMMTNLKHRQFSVSLRDVKHDSTHDRDDELMASIHNMEAYDSISPVHLTDGPVSTSPSILMGKMPKTDKVLKIGIMGKLTSGYEWRDMTLALTSVGLFFARPGTDVLRDLIPLYDVVDVKKRNDFPGDGGAAKLGAQLDGPSARGASATAFKMTSLVSDVEPQTKSSSLHIIQIRTTENGYNSGRTYYLRADSEAACNDWLSQLRSAVGQAILIREAGPSLFRRAKHRAHLFYHSFFVQTGVAVLIFCSFLVNIAQTELDGPEHAPIFDVLEIFFTTAFAVELVVNMFAHLLVPFFQVIIPHRRTKSRESQLVM
jgi:hypothetical protein